MSIVGKLQLTASTYCSMRQLMTKTAKLGRWSRQKYSRLEKTEWKWHLGGVYFYGFLAHKTGEKKGEKQKVKWWNKRDLESREDFSAPQWCFWRSAVQMELLTHCFNTLCFQQLHTVGDKGKKGAGDWTIRDTSLPASQTDRQCWSSN